MGGSRAQMVPNTWLQATKKPALPFMETSGYVSAHQQGSCIPPPPPQPEKCTRAVPFSCDALEKTSNRTTCSPAFESFYSLLASTRPENELFCVSGFIFFLSPLVFMGGARPLERAYDTIALWWHRSLGLPWHRTYSYRVINGIYMAFG